MTFSTADISYEPEPECLVVRIHTRCILTNREAAFAAVAAEIAARPIKAALVDVRKVPGPISFLDRVRLGESTAQYLTGLPIAALLTEEQVDVERIGRLVARNRGANVEIFTDEAQARAWVQKYLTPAG